MLVELGKLNLGITSSSVRVVVERTLLGVVDDAVFGIGGLRSDVEPVLALSQTLCFRVSSTRGGGLRGGGIGVQGQAF